MNMVVHGFFGGVLSVALIMFGSPPVALAPAIFKPAPTSVNREDELELSRTKPNASPY